MDHLLRARPWDKDQVHNTDQNPPSSWQSGVYNPLEETSLHQVIDANTCEAAKKTSVRNRRNNLP